ncbi:MAG: tetratricopeptide repeat protein [Elusimicrobia bacterium]|nr:tetratricopeptide repeat protein [Candidatus Obscuribacterium magneticum]
MKIKNFLPVLLLVSSFSMGARALDTFQPQDEFLQANQAYEKGEYDNALNLYLALTGKGYEGASLFYNIGNTYFRKGERGPAILWYERASRLDPRDPDIQFNLSLSKNHLKDEKENIFERLIQFFNAFELGLIFSALWWPFFILLGTRILGWLKGDLWPGLLLWSLGALVFCCGVWLGANLVITNEPQGIVTKIPGEVRNGPGMEYAVGFTVPEGTKVVLLNKRPDWVEVGVPQQGLKGWMPADEVEQINWNSASSS